MWSIINMWWMVKPKKRRTLMSSGTAIVKAKSGLNVRKGAGTNYAKIGALPHGAKVNFSGEQNGWLKITHNSQQGFISKQYTSVTSSATSGGNTKQTQNNVSASSKTVEITASALRVRRGPSTNYDQIGLLAQGKVVQVTGESNGWYRISYGGQEGWISAQFTKAVSGGASTSTTPAQTGEKSVNQKYTVTATALRVRTGPGTSYSQISMLSNGTVVTAVAESKGWLKIKFNAGFGWISGDYVVKGEQKSTVDTSGSGGKLRSLSTKEVARIESRRTSKTLVDLNTGKRFNISWAASPNYHSDCTPMTQADTNVMKDILHPGLAYDSSKWKNYNMWSWTGRPGAIKLSDGKWVACGFHMRPHAAIMGGSPGYPFQNESNQPLTGAAKTANGSQWRLGGHFCLYYGDSPGGTPSCNTAAKTAASMSVSGL